MNALPIAKPIYRLLVPLAVGALVYLCVLLAFDTVGGITEGFFTRELLFCILSSYLILEVNHYLRLGFNKWRRRFFYGHTVLLLGAAVVSSAVVVSFLLVAYFRLFEYMTDISTYATELRIFNGIFLFVALMYQGHFLGFYMIQARFEQEMEREEQEKESLERNVSLFHYMLNPEFLLSGLESILLRLREKKYGHADAGILLLSDIYRHYLEAGDELVSVADEMEAMKKAERFLGMYLHKHILVERTPKGKEMWIVPRTLTKILEAAAYSQLSSPECPLEITLETRENDLVVRFPCNFSLLSGNQLYKVLEEIREQHRWLGKTFHWTESEYVSVFIPLIELSQANHSENETKESILTDSK